MAENCFIDCPDVDACFQKAQMLSEGALMPDGEQDQVFTNTVWIAATEEVLHRMLTCPGPIEVGQTIVEQPLPLPRVRRLLGIRATRQIVTQVYECARRPDGSAPSTSAS